ncbi:hypothetical protein ASG60_20725 [Methylobacterium sp. Leaf469]|uniref:hypothetical protein n=1 Tax=Methylobacterium sp. Leaf469 TaxID=1736387 RepID=UPI0006FB0E27|nr:hypothetical protein [Methylobacterium sp. Leaf469]KQT96061.1 hypothetical protein ASG60_20725 [Methylobacterium sp. Leaf469]
MTAPRHDPAGLAARIRSTIAEIDALDAQARAIATMRAARDAEVRRMAYQLARIPPDEDAAPVLQAPESVPIAQAARIAKCGDGTLHRHGDGPGWVFKRGGRWYVNVADLRSWMSGRQPLPRARA